MYDIVKLPPSSYWMDRQRDAADKAGQAELTQDELDERWCAMNSKQRSTWRCNEKKHNDFVAADKERKAALAIPSDYWLDRQRDKAKKAGLAEPTDEELLLRWLGMTDPQRSSARGNERTHFKQLAAAEKRIAEAEARGEKPSGRDLTFVKQGGHSAPIPVDQRPQRQRDKASHTKQQRAKATRALQQKHGLCCIPGCPMGSTGTGAALAAAIARLTVRSPQGHEEGGRRHHDARRGAATGGREVRSQVRHSSRNGDDSEQRRTTAAPAGGRGR